MKGFATQKKAPKPSQNEAIRMACACGYTSDETGIHTPKGRPLLVKRVGKELYPRVTLHLPDAVRVNVLAHRLVAYFKFGELALMDHTQVRHLNGNSADCAPSNLGLGDAGLNARDKSPELRSSVAAQARRAQLTKQLRCKLSPDAIESLRCCPAETLPALAASLGVSTALARHAAHIQ